MSLFGASSTVRVDRYLDISDLAKGFSGVEIGEIVVHSDDYSKEVEEKLRQLFNVDRIITA